MDLTIEQASSTWAGQTTQVVGPNHNRSGWLGPLRLTSLNSKLGFGPHARSAEEAEYRIQMTEWLQKSYETSYKINEREKKERRERREREREREQNCYIELVCLKLHHHVMWEWVLKGTPLPLTFT